MFEVRLISTLIGLMIAPSAFAAQQVNTCSEVLLSESAPAPAPKSGAMSNDPLFLNRLFESNTIPWNLSESGTNVVGLWNYITGGRDLLVAVIDSGFDWTHPDLAGVFDWSAYANGHQSIDEVRRECLLQTAHGTGVVGVMAAKANNGIGIAGVNGDARILAIPQSSLGDLGESPHLFKSPAEMIRFAVDHGAKIINTSWGTLNGANGNTPDFYQAIQYAQSKDVLIVAAAPNGVSDLYQDQSFPSAYSLGMNNVISVAGFMRASTSDSAGRLIQTTQLTSHYNPFIVDVAAPADHILTLKDSHSDGGSLPDGYNAEGAGTSDGTPMVTGIVNLLWLMKKDLQPKDLRNILIETSRKDGVDATVAKATRSGGVVNAGAAGAFVTKIKEGAFAVAPRMIPISIQGSFDISIFSTDPYTIKAEDPSAVTIRGTVLTPLKGDQQKVYVQNSRTKEVITVLINPG